MEFGLKARVTRRKKLQNVAFTKIGMSAGIMKPAAFCMNGYAVKH